MSDYGLCRNAGCGTATAGTLVERYPGPGEFCPECGEVLQAAQPRATAAAAPAPAPAAAPVAKPDAAPFGGLSALEALKQFEPVGAPPAPPAAASAAPNAAKPRSRPLIFASAGAAVVAVVAAVVILRPMAIGHPASGDTVRVCHSSITERYAGALIRAYGEKTATPMSHFSFAQSSPCDVQISAGTEAVAGDVVGHDGIVIVVNPQNPVARLTGEQLRQIFTGEITDWSQAGGGRGPITAMLPAGDSDEAKAFAQDVMHGQKVGNRVTYLGTSADVVHAVSGPRGRGTIGIVAFSDAVPAKVVRLGTGAAPSALSIAAHNYPLSVAVTVVAPPGAHPAGASALADFAHSDSAQAIVVQSGFVPKKGL